MVLRGIGQSAKRREGRDPSRERVEQEESFQVLSVGGGGITSQPRAQGVWAANAHSIVSQLVFDDTGKVAVKLKITSARRDLPDTGDA